MLGTWQRKHEMGSPLFAVAPVDVSTSGALDKMGDANISHPSDAAS